MRHTVTIGMRVVGCIEADGCGTHAQLFSFSLHIPASSDILQEHAK